MTTSPLTPPSIDWLVVPTRGSAEEFHHRDPGQGSGHQLWVHTTPGPALILGSTQPDGLLDRDRAAADGIEVCRRRSGGGLVHLDPVTDCWVDAIVPAGSPLWETDIGRAFHWIGQAWASTIDRALGPGGPALVHLDRTRPGGRNRPLWCFAGLGHGEVTVGASKVVGLSQRRTRDWVRLQSLVIGRWPGRRLLPYLDVDVARTIRGVDPDGIDPATVRAGPPPGIGLPDPQTLAAAFIEQVRHG